MQENNTQAAIDAGKEIVLGNQKIQYLGDIPFVIKADGVPTIMQNALELLDKRSPAPRRLTGCAKFTELASFIDHVERFKDQHSAVFMHGNALTAVYNYHVGIGDNGDGHPGVPAAPRWADHRATYAAPFSPEWDLWNKNDGKLMTQEEFGEFIDQNIKDIAAPVSEDDKKAGYVGAGALSTMARNLVINAGHKAERKINEQTGEITMHFEVKIDEQSSTKLPPGFLLGIPVFEKGPGYRIEAKFYLQRAGQGFKLGYKLVRAADVLQHAVDEIRDAVKKQTNLPVWAGSPEY